MGNSIRVSTTSSRMRGHDSRPHKVRSHRVRSSTNDRNSSSAPSTLPDVLDKPESEVLRRARTEYYNQPAGECQRNTHKEMASDYSRRRELGPRVSTMRESNRAVREFRESHSSEHRRRRRKAQDLEGGGNENIGYVYKSTGDSINKRDLPSAPRLRRTSDTVNRSRADSDRERRDDPDAIRVSSRSRKHFSPERQRMPLPTNERRISRTASRRARPYFPDFERAPLRTEERPLSRTAARSRTGAAISR